jgi:hypothetical protein
VANELTATPVNSTILNVYNKEITITYGGAHEGPNVPTAIQPITVNPKDTDLSQIVFENKEVTYDGAQHSIVINENALPEGITVSYQGNNLLNAGEHLVTATFVSTNPNIQIPQGQETKTATLKILPREIEVKIHDKTSVFGQEVADLTYEVTAGEVVTGEDLGLILSTAAKDTSVIGDYIIAGTWTNTNYNIVFTNGTYTITAASHDMSNIKFENSTETYDGTPHNIEITGNLPEGVTVKYEENGQINAGTYTVTAIFEVDAQKFLPVPSMTATLEILKREVEITIDDKETPFGEPLAELTSDVTKGSLITGDDLRVVLSTLAVNNSSVGETFPITGTWNNSNYNVTFGDGTYTIGRVELSVTIGKQTSVYGDTINFNKDLFTLTSGTLLGTDTLSDLNIEISTLAGTDGNKGAGVHEIKGTWNHQNYRITFIDEGFEITPKEIGIRIHNKRQAIGGSKVALTWDVIKVYEETEEVDSEGNPIWVEIPGLVTGDKLEDLDITLYLFDTESNTEIAWDNLDTSNEKTYEIRGKWNNNNYYITFILGRYTVGTVGAITGDVLTSNSGRVHIAEIIVVESSEKIDWNGARGFRDSNGTLNIDNQRIVTTLKTDTDGSFEIELVRGTYDILIDKPGYLDYVIKQIEVKEGETVKTEVADLMAGDTNKDGIVNLHDLSLIYALFGAIIGDQNYSINADFTGTGIINLHDLSIIYANFGMTKIIKDHK